MNSGQECALLENRAARKGAWNGIQLQGTPPCNRDAIGSLITLKTTNGTRRVETRNSQSYMAANDPRIILALEKGAPKAPPLEVRWSDGLREVFRELETQRYHLLVRGMGEKIEK